MIQITFQFHDIAAAAALFAKLDGTEIGAITGAPAPAVVKAVATGVTANEKTAVLLANEAALADTVEAPGKRMADAFAASIGKTPEEMMAPNPMYADLKFVSAAPTAPSPRTAEAAPSTSAPSPAAPAPSTEATPQAADASSASQPADTFDYATLQKAVNAAVPKHGKDKLLAVAKKHGADNFKGLPASAWAAAHADVVALG